MAMAPLHSPSNKKNSSIIFPPDEGKLEAPKNASSFIVKQEASVNLAQPVVIQHSNMSTKDYNKFKELLDKFPMLEEKTDNFIKDIRRFNFTRMKDEIESLGKRMNLMVSQTELKIVRLEILANFQKIDKINEEVKELQESHKWLTNQVMLSKNLASPEVIGNLKTQVDKVEQIQTSMKKAVETVKA
jgi:hypothetical protein